MRPIIFDGALPGGAGGNADGIANKTGRCGTRAARHRSNERIAEEPEATALA